MIISLLVVAGGGAGVLTFDVDGDLGSGLQEFEAGTNPLVSDTDGDGLWDGNERRFGSDPTSVDTDGDGLYDGREYRGTSRDSDRVSGTGVVWSKSNPRSPDTDGDGLDDATEYDEGLNPIEADTDGDGLSDPDELADVTDPANPDTDGDQLLDGWEVNGESEKGAPLPGADPLHKDMYVQVTYLRGVQQKFPASLFETTRQWFAEMPVENPDGETGITVRFYADDDYAGPINRSIDEWTKSNGETTAGVSGFMAMREFYNRETMGPRVGSYFLVVVPNSDVNVRGHGNAGGTKVSIVRPWPGTQRVDVRTWAHTVTHEVLHNIVRRVGGRDCNGQMHTCEGFLSYNDDYFLSEKAAGKLNSRGFAAPEYREQMNATSCEDTISDPSECGAPPREETRDEPSFEERAAIEDELTAFATGYRENDLAMVRGAVHPDSPLHGGLVSEQDVNELSLAIGEIEAIRERDGRAVFDVHLVVNAGSSGEHTTRFVFTLRPSDGEWKIWNFD